MIELEVGRTLGVTLKEDAEGRDRPVVSLQARGCKIDLTPHQARVLATELIMAVNRAEVRSNIKFSASTMRGLQPGARKGTPDQECAK